MKKLTLLLAIVLLISCLGGGISAAFATTGNDFDNTNVLDDLHDLNLSDYLSTQGKKAQLVTLAEYCYTYRANMRGNYALYMYIYNPQRINFANSTSNQIQFATSYNEKGIPDDYKKFPLKLCSTVTSGQYAGLFYKYKVIDTSEILTNAVAYEKDFGVRRYDLAGAELLTAGQTNAIDYKIAASYRYTGYALGCGRYEDVDTLDCEVKDLDVVELEVQHISFRPGVVSSKGAGHQNELNGVYFAVDNNIMQKYGRLQKIKAEWYEYKTQPIVVTTSSAVNDKVKPLVGVDISKGYDANKVNSAVDLRMFITKTFAQNTTIYDFTYNSFVGTSSSWGSVNYYISENICNRLPYLFHDGNQAIAEYTVSSSELERYIKNYNKSAVNGYLPIKDGQVSADLFLKDHVDAGRTFGYNIREFDADSVSDQFNLLSYESNHSGWERFFEFFFSNVDTSTDYKDIKPIVEVTDSHLWGTDKEISDRLHLPIGMVQSFKDYHADQKRAGKQTYIFWFASNDYFAKPVSLFWNGGSDRTNTEIRQATVRMSFDILTLTFNKDGTYTTLAAVSNPIDMFPALTPGLTDNDLVFPYITVVLLGLVIISVFITAIFKTNKGQKLKFFILLLIMIAALAMIAVVLLQYYGKIDIAFVQKVIEIDNGIVGFFKKVVNFFESWGG